MPRPRLTSEKKLRRTVHVLLDDIDYLRLLQISSPDSISSWGRDAIKERLDRAEAALQLTPQEFYDTAPEAAD